MLFIKKESEFLKFLLLRAKKTYTLLIYNFFLISEFALTNLVMIYKNKLGLTMGNLSINKLIKYQFFGQLVQAEQPCQ